MPSQWLAIDDNFPSFTGAEAPGEQIRALHNYLYQLRESLQYSLRNLTADNFNAAALQNMSAEQKNEVTKQLEKVYSVTSELSAKNDKLDTRVRNVEKLPGRLEEIESELQENAEAAKQARARAEEAAAGIAKLQETQSGSDRRLNELQELATSIKGEVDRLSAAIGKSADGGLCIGVDGGSIHLIGKVYINGVLYTQGEEV